ncbi:MAG: DUF3109 family protein [Flavobacteriales bacterium]|nr:DUF3109 family protein [Flavobacteriales bacterium]MCB9446718.1 DUF3109 family protein [Flavobacteriales bacterium]
MIVIDSTLVSEELLETRFHCDLGKCHGECCVQGDAGAPLDASEIPILEEVYDDVKPYMAEKGIAAVDKQGVAVQDNHGEWVTPLVENKECAFVVFEKGIAICAIEKAFRDGKVTFRKPVSCHLYPVRITRSGVYDHLNYHEWDICKPALSCGKKKGMPVFRFVKDALIRKYGEDWYGRLEWAADNYKG